MQQFDRITRDMAVLAGQACIRGTSIPVYTIANLRAQGVATADILTRYPLLDTEDILQAAAYTIRELLYVMDRERYEVKSSLAAIQSGCQLLHEMDIVSTVHATITEAAEANTDTPTEALIEEEDAPSPAKSNQSSTKATPDNSDYISTDLQLILDVLDILQDAASRSIDAQDKIHSWLYFYRDPSALTPEWWPYDLASLVENAIKHYTLHMEGKTIQPAAVNVSLPPDLPPIKSTGQLTMALGYLLTVLHVIPKNSPHPFERHLTAAVTADGESIRVQIQHHPISGRFLTSGSGELGLAKGNRQLAALFIPGNLYATAALLVEQAGGKLETRLTADTLELVVTLPIWQIPTLIGVAADQSEAVVEDVQ